MKETSSQDKEVHIIDVFQTNSPSKASYDKTSQGRKYYFLTISFSPDSTTFTCNFCQDEMEWMKWWNGKISSVCKIPVQDLTKKILYKKCIKWLISMGKGLWSKLDSWLHGKGYFMTIGWLNAMSQSAKRPTFFWLTRYILVFFSHFFLEFPSPSCLYWAFFRVSHIAGNCPVFFRANLSFFQTPSTIFCPCLQLLFIDLPSHKIF